jgi:hypothetical protein
VGCLYGGGGSCCDPLWPPPLQPWWKYLVVTLEVWDKAELELEALTYSDLLATHTEVQAVNKASARRPDVGVGVWRWPMASTPPVRVQCDV